LSDAERNSRWLMEFGVTMAKGALKKTSARSAARASS